MRMDDLWLIGKKVLVGAVITMAPLVVVFSALWLTQHSLK